jgi:Carboxypeptidase regulatory-like domain
MSRAKVQQLVCGFLFLLASCPAFGCTCDPGLLAACQRLRSYHGTALFLGVAGEIQYKTIVIDKISFRQQVVRFSVEEAFAGFRSKTITVTQPPMCGYEFQKGVRYLVDAEGSTESSLEVGSCGMTTPAEYAADSIHFLRTLKQNQTGAIVFGTVKQYVKGSTFVSLNNKPVAGASVLLQAAPDGLLHAEERHAAVDSSGYYEFVGLPEGIYTHTVTVPEGFTGVLEHTVEVKKDSCAQVDVRVDRKAD